jgi:hypothetical protein
MRELSGRNFGVLIAYLLPGFVSLWAVAMFSPAVDSWLSSTPNAQPTVGGFLYTTLGSLSGGLTVSAVRWAVVDTFHHTTGLVPPEWDFSKLRNRLDAFEALVENHYRYYQFYANMLVAVVAVFLARATQLGTVCSTERLQLVLLMLAGVFLAASRDTLGKYYARASQLLGTRPNREKGHYDDERISSRSGHAVEEGAKGRGAGLQGKDHRGENG